MIRRVQRTIAKLQGRILRALGVPDADGSIRILVAPGGSTVVRLDPDGTLSMQAPGSVRFRMYADADPTLAVPRTPWRLTFTKDETGRVVGLVAELAPRVTP